MSAVI